MNKIYAFDFDGTLCIDAFPGIGKPRTNMLRYAELLKNRGNKLILWTCRNGERLNEALEWCTTQGITFDAVNENLPETLKKYGTDSRKITADYYIDDKMLSFFYVPIFLLSSNFRFKKEETALEKDFNFGDSFLHNSISIINS